MSEMFSNRYFRWYLTALLAFVFSSGCVYYNTFFMARKKFEEAEKNQALNAEGRRKQGIPPGQIGRKGRNQSKGNVGGGGGPSGSFTPNITPQVRILYEDAIKKASKVLRFHPDSKWVDDALWLIGKSYYNMGDYLQADRKFKELVTNQPESKYADDSFFYGGLCQIELGHGDLAMEAFERIERDSKQSEYIDDVYFVRGKIAKDDERYVEAIDHFHIYLEKYSREDSAARAKFYIGECREQLGNYYEAFSAYSEVDKYKPSKQLRFDATLASASAILKTDSVSRGMEILMDLAQDERYFEQSARIRLKIAEGHHLQGQIEDAIGEYNQVAEQSPKTLEAAEAYYRLGLIYQNDIYDLEKAKVSFSKAQTENSSSEFRNLALARSAQIAKLESYRIQLQRADSIRAADQSGARRHGDTPDTLTSAEILGENIIGPEEVEDSSFTEPGMSEGMEKEDSATGREEEIFTVPIETAGENIDTIDSTEIASAPGEDSVEVDMGEFYTVPLDSLNGALVTLNRADTTNTTAGQDSMSTGKLDIPESEGDEISLEDSVRAAEAARWEKARQDKITQDSIRQEITKRGIETRFLLAELYAYELNRPDSALREYVLIADQHPNSEYVLRALLASAFLEFDGGDSTVAEEYLYRLIENYP
ncbi:MAG: tetratricopeptide repeat protein, partial [candidate division Zixibacteria bacterium]